jgi:two-component system cell cycle response regulator DivK
MAKAKVLVVEDNADNLALVRFLLERAGYEVLSTGSGLECLRLARQEKPNLILMDLAIPELDGWSASKELKADPATKNIPVVALTAYTLPADRKRAQEAGCEGFIPKPMNVVGFINEIAGFIDRHTPKDTQ